MKLKGLCHCVVNISPKKDMFLSLNTNHSVPFYLIFMSYMSMYLLRIDVFVYVCVEIKFKIFALANVVNGLRV